MSWIEASALEKDIIICIGKKKKSISHIAEETNKTTPNISQTVSRMLSEGLVLREHEYGRDARTSKVSLNKENVRIKNTHFFYIIYFILTFSLIISSTIISFYLISTKFLLGTLLGVLPTFFYILYQAYIVKDRVVVEKRMSSDQSEE